MANKKYNHQWDRVIRTPQDPKERASQEANKSILNSDMFRGACVACEIEATKRQVSKYRHKKGVVYKYLNGIL